MWVKIIKFAFSFQNAVLSLDSFSTPGEATRVCWLNRGRTVRPVDPRRMTVWVFTRGRSDSSSMNCIEHWAHFILAIRTKTKQILRKVGDIFIDDELIGLVSIYLFLPRVRLDLYDSTDDTLATAICFELLLRRVRLLVKLYSGFAGHQKNVHRFP